MSEQERIEEKPTRAQGDGVATCRAGMLAGGAVVGAVGTRLGMSNSTGQLRRHHRCGASKGTGEEAASASKTFVPPGAYDPYFIFASGGHSGQGVRHRRPVDAREGHPGVHPRAWQGYGFGSDQSELVLTEGSDPAKNNMLGWGDTHHPALSETGGDYDGRWLYINDRANGRIAMIDRR